METKHVHHLSKSCLARKKEDGSGCSPKAPRKRNAFLTTAIKDTGGFTLIEIIVVIVILGLLASIAGAKVLDLDESSSRKALQVAVSDLNERERHSWMQAKLSTTNWINDDQVFMIMDTDLGPGYRWSSKTAAGGTLHCNGQSVSLRRTPSSTNQHATWNAL